MTAIWRALVAEPRKAVDEHYNAIMKELLKVRGAVPVCLCATARPFPRLRRSPPNKQHTDWSLPHLMKCGFLMWREGKGCIIGAFCDLSIISRAASHGLSFDTVDLKASAVHWLRWP